MGLAHLPAQQMKVLRGRRQVADLDVLLGAELQVPLDARARVLRALALVPVGKQEREARDLAPLVLARS